MHSRGALNTQHKTASPALLSGGVVLCSHRCPQARRERRLFTAAPACRYFALSGLFAGCVAVAVTYMARAHPSGRALALAAGAVAFAAAAAMAGSATLEAEYLPVSPPVSPRIS